MIFWAVGSTGVVNGSSSTIIFAASGIVPCNFSTGALCGGRCAGASIGGGFDRPGIDPACFRAAKGGVAGIDPEARCGPAAGDCDRNTLATPPRTDRTPIARSALKARRARAFLRSSGLAMRFSLKHYRSWIKFPGPAVR